MSLIGEKLFDHVAYVTGASSGIGAACARRLAEHGASVVLGARRTDRLAEVADDVKTLAPSVQVCALPLDVNDDASVDAFLKDAEAKVGPCDILINNAGLAAGKDPVVDADVADWDRMLSTNVRSLFVLTKKVLRGMLDRGHGDLVNIASMAGVEPYPGGSVYCASKAAVQAFAESLRHEVLGKNIRVMTMDPGMADTEFSLVRLGSEEAAKDAYKGLIPLSGDDVADCVVFALSRPRHMSLDRMYICATAQAGTRNIHREDG